MEEINGSRLVELKTPVDKRQTRGSIRLFSDLGRSTPIGSKVVLYTLLIQRFDVVGPTLRGICEL